MTPHHFFNRELSWIEFNARVLTEASRPEVPLLERLRFTAIASSNFDEFFMVRVAGLKRQEMANENTRDISGMTVQKQLELISVRVHELTAQLYHTLNTVILPELAENGITYISRTQYTEEQRLYVETMFHEEIFPLLTPLRTDTSTALPNMANLKLHAAFQLEPLIPKNSGINAAEHRADPFMHTEGVEPVAIVQIPSAIKRVIWIPADNGGKAFTLLDDIIEQFGTQLFPGYKVAETLLFKVTRDADFPVDEERNTDFIRAMEEVLVERQSSIPVRLTCNNTSRKLAHLLAERLQLTERDIYRNIGILDLATLSVIADTEGFDTLKYPAWKNFFPAALEKKAPMWDVIAARDILLHVPFESYEPVISFIRTAAEDSAVLAIKITLYRTSGNSPIVHALKKAAQNGKQVTVYVELKARFNEQQNINWASQLERAGVIVVYGIANLKVHAKLALVVRREHGGIKRYTHLSTGNYNERTAKSYADLSLFTANAEIANDATLFFNMISGYSAIQTMKLLTMAPVSMKTQLISMIDREASHSTPETPGFIMAKMNSLGEPDIIEALYRASRAHVHIMLNVRGICMLVPGIPGTSEHITVVSVIDRFLEHSRIFYFQNGGAEELYLSSADWLERNLDKRVELMFPILQKDLFGRIKDILCMYFKDNCKSYRLQKDGTWTPETPRTDTPAFRVQEALYARYKEADSNKSRSQPLEFLVRRKK